MKIVLLHLSTAKEEWADLAAQVYLKKISGFLPITEEALKPRKTARSEAEFKKSAESLQILDFCKADDLVWLFDERGENLDSRAFAKKLERSLGTSKKRLVLVIGGAYGVTEDVRKRADTILSLSPMVMNHLLAKTVALEQVYRGFTILKNIPYHND